MPYEGLIVWDMSCPVVIVRYEPEYYVELLTRLNSEDNKVRLGALNELNKALDDGQHPGDDVARRVREISMHESDWRIQGVAKQVHFECIKAKVGETCELVDTVVSDIAEKKRTLPFFSRPKAWTIEEFLPDQEKRLVAAKEVRRKIKECEEKREALYWKAEYYESKQQQVKINGMLEELQELVPQMLTEDEEKLIVINRKEAAARAAEEAAKLAKHQEAFAVLKKLDPSTDLDETCPMDEIIEATAKAKIARDAEEAAAAARQQSLATIQRQPTGAGKQDSAMAGTRTL